MPRGYRSQWFVVETELIDNAKWMSLDWAERGKWLAVRALAERQTTGSFTNRDHLAILLRKEGDETPEQTINRLVEVRLLDVSADGRVLVHDIEEYSRPSSTERVQRHRETERNGPKRRETDTHTHTHTQAGPPPPARVTGGPAREDGETLRHYLERIGAPIPDVAAKETTSGTNGTESSGDPDGKSRRRPRKRREASG